MAKTDREKRAELDAHFRRKYPDATAEQIRQLREEYVGKRSERLILGLALQPEERKIRPEKLTLETMTRLVTEEKKFFQGTLLILVLFFPIPAIATFLGVRTGAWNQGFFWVCLIAMLLLLYWAIHLLRSNIRERRNLKRQLPAGQLRLVRYTVADMEQEDVGSDTRDMEYRLHLTGGEMEKPWICPCSKFQYETTREGDTVYLVYQKDAKEHCWLFSDAAWMPDEQVKALMDRAEVPGKE